MQFLFHVAILMVIFNWALSSLYVLDGYHRAPGCPDMKLLTKVTYHVTTCAILCRRILCKYFSFKDGECHIVFNKEDYVSYGESSVYVFKGNHIMTNLAAGSDTASSKVFVEELENDNGPYNASYSAIMATHCKSSRFQTTETSQPWLRIDLGKNYSVHSINILPVKKRIQHFQDIKVYISTTANQNKGDFSAFSKIADFEGPYNSSQSWLNHNFNVLSEVRYVAVQRDTSNGELSFEELEVLGEFDDLTV